MYMNLKPNKHKRISFNAMTMCYHVFICILMESCLEITTFSNITVL